MPVFRTVATINRPATSGTRDQLASVATAGSAGPAGFRRDIEGLRGIAVLLVVLFHCDIAWFSGGYIGVDVFFVISGFLITGALWREAGASGGVRLATFWARRARRLLPALFLMTAATLVLAYAITSPLAWRTTAVDAASVVTYRSNLHFDGLAGGYFGKATSPLLHTWSLSVEEQFYVLWPLAFALLARLTRRRPLARRRLVVGAVIAASIASLALSVWLTERMNPRAYYSVFSRAWEFGAGALLALTALAGRVPRRIAGAAGAAGLAAIIACAAVYDKVTPFPGYFAVLPVLATVAVLVAGDRSSGSAVARALAWRPLRELGAVSYAWYLWHWPLIVLANERFGPLHPAAKLAAAIIALGVSFLTYSLVENPLRHHRSLRRPAVALTAAAVATVGLTGGAWALTRHADRLTQEPYLSSLAAAREARTNGGPGCTPAISRAELCEYGSPSASRTIVVVGDSHAAHWSPAVIELAGALDARVIVRTRAACPAFDVHVLRTGTHGVTPSCLAFRDETNLLITEQRPDLVVLASADYFERLLDPGTGEVLHARDAEAAWARELSRYLSWLDERGTATAVIENNPELETDPIECLARHRSPERCAPPAAGPLGRQARRQSVERAVFAEHPRLATFDPTPHICDGATCRVEAACGPVYSDDDHLTECFVRSLATHLQPVLQRALSGLSP